MNDELTITAWCNINDWYQSWNVFAIAAKYNPVTDFGWDLSLYNPITNSTGDDIGLCSNYPTYFTTNCSYTFHTWDFYAASFSKIHQSVKIYKNGTLLSTFHTPVVELENTGSGDFYIGYSPAGPDEYSDGDIDDVKVYNRALSDNEILALYSSALISPLVNSNSPVCAGGVLNLTASTIPGAVYEWTGPNGFTSALQNPSISSVTVSNSGKYTLTVSGNGCMSASVSIAVVVNPPAVPLVNSNSPVCTGGVLNFTASNFPGAIYQWTGPNGFKSFLQNPSISPFNPSNFGTYTLTVNSSGCLSIPVSINVTGGPLPKVNLGKDTVFCEGESILLDAGAGYKYHWWNGAVVQTQVIADGGTYFVTVNNHCGAASDTIVIDEMDCSMEIFFPNSFTPNGDYTNQIWQPKGVNIDTYEVLIYDRWGELIFKSNSLTKGWDGTYKGKDCESDVYCYVAKYADKMHADKSKMKTRKGVITLVR